MGCFLSKIELFMEIAKQASSSKHIVVEDVKIEQQPFYDLLNELSKNTVLEYFELKNIEILGMWLINKANLRN